MDEEWVCLPAVCSKGQVTIWGWRPALLSAGPSRLSLPSRRPLPPLCGIVARPPRCAPPPPPPHPHPHPPQDTERRRFSPLDRIADPAVAVAQIQTEGQYVASPSIVRLPSGRLLTVFERSVSWGFTAQTTTKYIHASTDGGATWAQAGSVSPMNWPQLLVCKSGVYIIGTERHFSPDNNLVVSKMLDSAGERGARAVRFACLLPAAGLLAGCCWLAAAAPGWLAGWLASLEVLFGVEVGGWWQGVGRGWGGRTAEGWGLREGCYGDWQRRGWLRRRLALAWRPRSLTLISPAAAHPRCSLLPPLLLLLRLRRRPTQARGGPPRSRSPAGGRSSRPTRGWTSLGGG